jgi:molecular chaperone GrpE
MFGSTVRVAAITESQMSMTPDTADDDVLREGSVGDGDGDDGSLEALRAERDEMKDLLLRKQAEFENFRKRTERERSEFAQFALADCMTELLNVLDSFELALRDSGAGGGADESVHRGYELIYKQLVESLGRFGLEAIDARGVEFDPHLHQAVSTQPAPEGNEGRVLEELRKGYLLKGRLLRPAMVVVASAPDESAT